MTPEYLTLSSALWQATLDALTPYRVSRVEGGCLWYGQRDVRAVRAEVVGIPRQTNRPRNFAISPEALAELNALIPDDLVVVAQVHLHPGIATTHSQWDNEMMVSRRAFSLVLPRYAARPCDVHTVGVHVHDGRGWVKLREAEGRRRVIVDQNEGRPARPILVDGR